MKNIGLIALILAFYSSNGHSATGHTATPDEIAIQARLNQFLSSDKSSNGMTVSKVEIDQKSILDFTENALSTVVNHGSYSAMAALNAAKNMLRRTHSVPNKTHALAPYVGQIRFNIGSTSAKFKAEISCFFKYSPNSKTYAFQSCESESTTISNAILEKLGKLKIEYKDARLVSVIPPRDQNQISVNSAL